MNTHTMTIVSCRTTIIILIIVVNDKNELISQNPLVDII